MQGTRDVEDGHKGLTFTPVSALPPGQSGSGMRAWVLESYRLDSNPSYPMVAYVTLGKLHNPLVLKLPSLERITVPSPSLLGTLLI